MTESVIPIEDLDGVMNETLLVRQWRAEQLRRLGVPSILAEMLADDVDWRGVSTLIERGCPLGLALDIVR